jgi:hypothetical protein
VLTKELSGKMGVQETAELHEMLSWRPAEALRNAVQEVHASAAGPAQVTSPALIAELPQLYVH